MAETTIYCGDLHANTTKLLLLLQQTGVLADLTASRYAALAEAYNNNNPRAYMQAFEQLPLVSTCRYHLVLLGDTTADRGANDFFTLYTLYKIAPVLRYTILYGNHEAELIANLNVLRRQQYARIASAAILPAQIGSLYHFRDSLCDWQETGNTRLVKLCTTLLENYLQHLQLLWVCHHQQGTCLATHAPLTPDMINELCHQATLAAAGSTPRSLNSVVSAVNRVFCHSLTPWQGAAMPAGLRPLTEALSWNRATTAALDVHQTFTRQLATPPGKPFYHLHGHHGAGVQLYPQGINLDNTTGKHSRALPWQTDLSDEIRILQ